MKISFSDLSIAEAQKLLAYATAAEVELTEEAPPSEEQPQKLRRRRRSKVEMAEARNQEARAAEEADAHPEGEPPRRRRGRAASDAEAADARGDEYDKPRRRRRRSAPDDDPSTAQPVGRQRRRGKTTAGTAPTVTSGSAHDEITDRDVAKAASEGAQELTPAAVRGILDPFGVSNVADLNQGQRREFINLIDAAIAGVDGDERGC